MAADRGLGAASGVFLDALVESESGVTPGPSLSWRVIALCAAALTVVTVILGVWAHAILGPQALPAGEYEAIWIEVASPEPDGDVLSLRLLPDATGGQEIPTWVARTGSGTAILINGGTADPAELARRLGPTAVRADVEASADGEISRIEIGSLGSWSD